MNNYEVGTPVMALLKAKDGEAHVLGEGTYQGEKVPPMEVSSLLHEVGMPNPEIKLDNGHTVYGCECWWGPTEKVKKRIEGMKIITVDMDDFRAERSPEAN